MWRPTHRVQDIADHPGDGTQRAEENAEDDCAQRIVQMQKKRHESVSKTASVPVVNIV